MKQLFQKDFTLVVIGQIISLFGNAILRFALPLYLLRTTGSAALFGIVSASAFLPMIILSFMGGILADRVNKRNIMVGLDFLTAAIVGILMIVLGKVAIVPLFIAVLMLLYGISGTYQPAVQASIPALVTQDKIMTASAIINQISALAGFLGPIIGGLLYGFFGIMPILTISVGCFLASAVMETFIRMPHTRRNDGLGVGAIIKGDLHDSITYIKNEKTILIKIIILVALFNLVLSAMMIVGLPILVVDTLQMSDQLLGITQGALALGGLVGGILTAVFSNRLKLSNAHILLLLASIGTGIAGIPLIVGMGNMISYIILTGICFVIMALSTMFSVQMMATIQIETPQELVGKVIALMMSIAMCAQPVGQAIYGIVFEQLADYTGWILISAGLIAVGLAVASKKAFRSL